MLRLSDSVKSFYILSDRTDIWENREDGYRASLRHVQTEMSAVFRVAAKLKVQRDELDMFAFYMAAAISQNFGGRNWGSVPGAPSVDSERLWERMKDPQTFAYALRVLRHFVASGFEVIQYICNCHGQNVPSGYVADLARQEGTAQFRIAYAESQAKHLSTRVPAEYARKLRRGHRTAMSTATVISMHRAHVPVEYAAASLANQLDPETIIDAWKAGVPLEYATAIG